MDVSHDIVMKRFSILQTEVLFFTKNQKTIGLRMHVVKEVKNLKRSINYWNFLCNKKGHEKCFQLKNVFRKEKENEVFRSLTFQFTMLS